MLPQKMSLGLLRSASKLNCNAHIMPLRYANTTAAAIEPARMEKTLNTVTLLGRVGADPQRRGSDNHPVAIFSMATHSNYRYETGEFLQRTEWHRVICFKPGLRETILTYLKKGQRVHVTGRITYGEVKGDDGKQRTTTAIAAEDVIFFNTNKEKEGEN